MRGVFIRNCFNIMNIVWLSLNDTLVLLWRVLPAMFIGLFGVEVLAELGLLRKLEALGRPLARISHLPPQSVPAFLTAIGSLVAANVMLSRYHADKIISGRELVLGSVFNTVPLHFKETLTYQLPVILPLLGPRLCLIYIVTFWIGGMLKLGFVVYRGKTTLARREMNGSQSVAGEAVSAFSIKDFPAIVRKAFCARGRLFLKTVTILLVVTFAIQMLIHSGAMAVIASFMAPVADVFNLPGEVAAPVSVYIVSPIVGISAMSALLKQQVVTEYQAIVALLVGSFFMVPVTRLRGTLPRYIAILGWKYAARVICITTSLTLVARGMVLIWVLLFFS